ncbi:MAG TPA: hypothetical protein ENJ23_00120, partial [Bacteroidetes bacterium]|nr:hypothetical protein [Bacteroidota bacterium]
MRGSPSSKIRFLFFGLVLGVVLAPVPGRLPAQNLSPDSLWILARKALGEKNYGQVARLLDQLLELDSTFQDASGKSAWYLLGLALDRQSEREEALRQLRRGRRILSQLGAKDPYLDFLLAQLYAERGGPAAGDSVSAFVYSAVQHLSPVRQKDLWDEIFDMLDIFLPKPEPKAAKKKAFSHLRPWQLMELAIRRLDPNPMTDANEALPVILRRAAVARKKYPDPGSPSGYDIRGDYFVRLGPPYRIYWTHSGVPGEFGYAIFPFEIWFYTKIHPKLYFTFARIRGESDFRKVDGPEAVIGSFYDRKRVPFNRQHIGETVTALRFYLYSELALYHEDFRHRLYLLEQQVNASEAADFADLRFRRDDEIQAQLAANLLQHVPIVPGEDVLRFSLDVDQAQFRAPGGQSRVEFYFGIPGGDLFFRETPAGPVSEVRAYLAVLDSLFRPVVRDTLFYRLSGTGFEKGGGLVGIWRQELQPGTYSFYLRVKDPAAKRGATYRDVFRVKRFGAGRFSASDLLLASRIQQARESSEFVKDSLTVLPAPSATVAAGDTLHLYFEVYDLATDAAGQSRMHIRYELDPLERPSGLPGFFARLFGKNKNRVELGEITS